MDSTGLSLPAKPNHIHPVILPRPRFQHFLLLQRPGRTWNLAGAEAGLTCRMTLSGWWKLGALHRTLEFSCVAGHRPRSFRPQVRTLRRMEGGMSQHIPQRRTWFSSCSPSLSLTLSPHQTAQAFSSFRC